MNDTPLIRIEKLKKTYTVLDVKGHRKKLKAVDDVDLMIMRGETFALVGESGCGKTTLGRLLLRLEKESSGEIFYDGRDITPLRAGKMGGLKNRMQIIYQNSLRSLDPYMCIRESLAEPLHGNGMKYAEIQEYLKRLLCRVGLNPCEMEKYPHELSGGQQQRVCIARALSTQPEFLFCDEPLTALDASVQAQIVNLLRSLQDEYVLTCLFVSHDLAMVRYISNRIGVMFQGRLMEVCDTEVLYRRPLHPYTMELLSCMPERGKKASGLPEPPGQLLWHIPAREGGCLYAARCPKVSERCREIVPELKQAAERHWCACHHIF